MLQSPQWVHGGTQVGVQGVKPLEIFGLFTCRVQINRLK